MPGVLLRLRPKATFSDSAEGSTEPDDSWKGNPIYVWLVVTICAWLLDLMPDAISLTVIAIIFAHSYCGRAAFYLSIGGLRRVRDELRFLRRCGQALYRGKRWPTRRKPAKSVP